jgi:hypothetical protein
MRRLIVLALLLGAVSVLVAQEVIPAGIPQQAVAAALKAKQWRQDAILVMVEVNDYSGTGKFTIQFSFYSPSNQTGLWVIVTAPGSSMVSQAGAVNWGTQAIPASFLDLPAAVQQARAQGMQGRMDHALLRVTSASLTWEITPASDPNLHVYSINAGLGVSSSATPQSDWLIVPGQRIGPVWLGMTAVTALKALGLQSETCNRTLINGSDLGMTYCNFRDLGLGINFEGDLGSQPSERRAVSITADAEEGSASRKYRTDRGIRIGSSDQDVWKAYGKLETKQSDSGNTESDLSYPALGIEFHLGGLDENSQELPKNIVGKIEITKPRQ